ncbi:MAG: hypothetical protein ACRESJ_27050, partial [Pseudomonas sp.]|uniref:hypothetical protein n=1 Tax=Pseudomonas sp. TaxID=306 RepID=UPI003D6E4B37
MASPPGYDFIVQLHHEVVCDVQMLAATFSEDECVVLVAVVWECRRPRPGVWGGALVVMLAVWCS